MKQLTSALLHRSSLPTQTHLASLLTLQNYHPSTAFLPTLLNPTPSGLHQTHHHVHTYHTNTYTHYHPLQSKQPHAALLSRVSQLTCSRASSSEASNVAAPQAEGKPLVDATFTSKLDYNVVVVGAGLSGMATAAALSKLNIPVHVLEKQEHVDLGGSYIFFLSNGWNVLEKLEVAEQLREDIPALRYLHVLDQEGNQVLEQDLHDSSEFTQKQNLPNVSSLVQNELPQEFRCVKATKLFDALRAKVGEYNISYNFQVKSVNTRFMYYTPHVVATSAPDIKYDCRAVLCADGPYTVGKPSFIPPPFQQSSIIRGHSVLSRDYPFHPQAFTYVIGKSARVQLFPTGPNSVHWCVLHAAPRSILTDSTSTSKDLREEAIYQCKDLPQSVIDIIAAEDADTRVSREGLFRTFASNRGKKSVTLLGSSLLPIVPDTAWGESLAVEDALIFGRCLRENWATDVDGKHIKHGMRTYETERHRRSLNVAYKAFAVNKLASMGQGVSKLLPKQIARGILSHQDYQPGSI